MLYLNARKIHFLSGLVRGVGGHGELHAKVEILEADALVLEGYRDEVVSRGSERDRGVLRRFMGFLGMVLVYYGHGFDDKAGG